MYKTIRSLISGRRASRQLLIVINLRIDFVGENQKIVFVRELSECLEILNAQDAASRFWGVLITTSVYGG